MVHVPGGVFLMGSDDFYPEERPVHRRTVKGFWMDRHPVTNAEFGRFVEDSGYDTSTSHVGFRCVVRASQKASTHRQPSREKPFSTESEAGEAGPKRADEARSEARAVLTSCPKGSVP